MKPTCECTCHEQATKEKDTCRSPEKCCGVIHHHCCCHCPDEQECKPCEGGGNDGNPGRPDKTTGTDNGRLDEPNPVLTPDDLENPNPPGVWVGPRQDLFLPFLFMRANPGDTGARPAVGPFWESPDILLLAGTEPASAPAIPPALGQTALANHPNTVYAHIWNFGQAQAPEVVVEFYWCDPTLGIGPSGAHLIGQTFASLGARGSGRAHRVVKCPVPWVPTFVNGGHECLVVRIWDIASDPLSTPPWDARLNRHIAQRNIHVEQAANAPHAKAFGGVHLLAQALGPALTLKVGPIYGMPAQVAVSRTMPHSMPWLQLHTGVRGQFPNAATPTGAPQLSSPHPIGAGAPAGPGTDQHQVTSDDQQVGFTTTDAHPAPGEAHVYRVTASQGGQVFGGYTVVLVG
jgi:hypothetical protein